MREPDPAEILGWLLDHLEALYSLYGNEAGARVARKHVGWYARSLPDGDALRRQINQLDDPAAQLSAVRAFFAHRNTHPGTPWQAEKRAA